MDKKVDDSILKRHTLGAAEIDLYSEDEYKAFGISRKAWGGEPMIDFISRCGNHRGLPYSQIDDIEFDPSIGIVIRYFNHQVTLRGTALFEGYQKLLMHRVVFVSEAGHAVEKLASGHDAVILELKIQARTAEPDLPSS